MLTRRRFLTITAATAGAAIAPAAAGAGTGIVEWRGTALGAEALLRLHHPDEAAAWRLVAACLAEVERLESIFSLYRPDSALRRLNREGALSAPPLDLVVLLGEATRYGDLTGGAFDVTVQPLWDLHARHFAAPDADPAGPPEEAVAAARALVDYRRIHVAADRIALGQPGMAVTLNGIAQGYITDRVAERLRAAGLQHVLVHLGETRALGPAEDGRPWHVGIADAAAPDRRPFRSVDLVEGAVASSGGYGTRFSAQCHHLFDPATGRSARHVEAVTVMAPTATAADALSTALAVLPPGDAPRLLQASAGARAIIQMQGGPHFLGSWPDAGPPNTEE
ncbi:FAD:protein FMN transferase [Azospirillum sp. TSO22-1]|uniref:FAD:protein FMN transferase n=1 Tax=Azospirillum sp. TSO22-1 TaxID=716789 RepID=UPI000D60AD31|nr:FAD:protein FMN transferase [Azospirillum sp. TSO22-1]PWC38940.1 thiamine biosynthesis protein ApbE [Azospirillum sp. TSO22-1]